MLIVNNLDKIVYDTTTDQIREVCTVCGQYTIVATDGKTVCQPIG